jgi:phosphohistidine phosphatase
MRHAKSDWGAAYSSDHDRPLNERGVRSARSMGRLLASEGIEPQVVVSSTALRARSSAELAIEAGGWEAELRLDPSLYDSGPGEVLSAGASTAPEVSRLMLVGHQPTWSMLVKVLTGERVDMKTASVAVVEMDLDSWGALPTGSGSLHRMLTPKPI